MSKVKVKLLRDYKGQKKGAEVSVSPRTALYLKNQGAAVESKAAAKSKEA